MCTDCLSEAFEWFDADGTGHVESWVAFHGRPGTDAAEMSPRIVATVELAEGPWMVSTLLDIDSNEVRYQMPVHVSFVRPDDSEAIPVFRPGKRPT
jgi:uncharacterized protein